MIKQEYCPKCKRPMVGNSEGWGKEKWVHTWVCANCGFVKTSIEEGRTVYPDLKCPKCNGLITYESFTCNGTELLINLRCEDCHTHYKLSIAWD